LSSELFLHPAFASRHAKTSDSLRPKANASKKRNRRNPIVNIGQDACRENKMRKVITSKKRPFRVKRALLYQLSYQPTPMFSRLSLPERFVLHPEHGCVNSQSTESPCGNWLHAGENLRRLKTSGVYYVFAKRSGKQFRRSLHTTDKAMARRMKDDFMRELDRLASAEAAQITFEQLAARWNEAERHTLKE
jgi:hypothetical protein